MAQQRFLEWIVCTSPPHLRLEEKINGAMARMSEHDWAPFRYVTSCFTLSQPAGAALYLRELNMEGWGWCRPMCSPPTRSSTASARGYPCSAYLVDGLPKFQFVKDVMADVKTCIC